MRHVVASKGVVDVGMSVRTESVKRELQNVFIFIVKNLSDMAIFLSVIHLDS